MWEKNITNLNAEGTFRSLNGAADENIFIGKASKAGFFCFFKVWRDMPYDAVLDSNGTLFRVEVKGSSSDTFNVTRGGRSGAQINRDAENRTRILDRGDCDFVVGVDSNNGDCYIIPTDIVLIFDRQNLTKNSIATFKEQWKLFIHGLGRLPSNNIRDGLFELELAELTDIARHIGAIVPREDIIIRGARRLVISDNKEKTVIKIWEKLCE